MNNFLFELTNDFCRIHGSHLRPRIERYLLDVYEAGIDAQKRVYKEHYSETIKKDAKE